MPGAGEAGEAGPAILGRGSLEALRIVGSISSKMLRLRRGGGLCYRVGRSSGSHTPDKPRGLQSGSPSRAEAWTSWGDSST